MNPALLQKGSNSFRTDSEIKDHEGHKKRVAQYYYILLINPQIKFLYSNELCNETVD